MREKRLKGFSENYFDTIIIDEAHHAISDGYQRVLDHFPKAQVLGVTATPDRGDMKNLGSVFDSLAYEYTLPQAIKEGYLSPIKAITIPLKLDLSGVSTQAGDFKASDIDTALDPYLYQIADEMLKYCKERKTVVFLPLVKTSQKFRDILISKGFNAAEVNGKSTDRAEILEAFDKGEYNVLCNSMLLTEGWDCPSVDCVIVLRPTKVRGLYCQMVGRGTRLCEGKSELLLLDFLWHTERHELCRPAHLICQNEEVAEKMTENLANEAGCAVDIEEAEKQARQAEYQIEREKNRADMEIQKARRKAKSEMEDMKEIQFFWAWGYLCVIFFSLIQNGAFQRDLMQLIMLPVNWCRKYAIWFEQLDYMGYSTGEVVFERIFSSAVIMAGIVGGVFLVWGGIERYRKIWDDIYKMVLIASFSFIAVLGNLIREYLPFNLLFVIFVINVGAVLIRIYLNNKNVGY